MKYLEALFKNINKETLQVNKIRRSSWPEGDHLEFDNHGRATKTIAKEDDWEVYLHNFEMLENDWEVYND